MTSHTAETRSPIAPVQGADRVALCAAADPALAELLRATLEKSGLQALALESADDLPQRAKARQPALIVLEAPVSESGHAEALRRLDELKANAYTHAIPVVLVASGEVDEERQLQAFRQGVDDYVARPTSGELFAARLRAATRRLLPPEESAESLALGDLVLDLRARRVTVGGAPVSLTRKEFDLLNTLMRRRGVVVYTTHLYHTVWGYGDSAPVDSHTVKVHVSSLRGKLGPEIGRKIVNLPGLGYRFDG